jgi:hypothetical protein
VQLDGRSTCQALGLGEGPLTDSFDAFWQRYFWDGAHFEDDTAIATTGDIARAAKEAGAEVFYLTGRIDSLHAATVAELKRLGLPDSDRPAHVLNKASTPLADGRPIRTDEFKAREMRRLVASGVHVGFFVTEGKHDIGRLQADVPEVQCVRLDSPLDDTSQPVRADTPLLRP